MPKYNDCQQTKEKTSTTKHIGRRRLHRLCQMRFDTHFLPDNDDGRAMLLALLCFGLTDDAAITDAPWCGQRELSTMKRRARRMEWRDVGKLIRLTYAEYETAKLWLLRPCDVSPEELGRRNDERRRKLDRERRKREREEQRTERERMRTTSDRGESLLRMLKGGVELFPRKSGIQPPDSNILLQCHDGWMPVSALVVLAQNCRAFRRPDGRQPSGRNALRVLVHREVTRLANKGDVETKLEAAMRGHVLMVRKVGKTDAIFDHNSITPDFQAKRKPFQQVV
jgi:hypothetical protein